MGGAPPEHPEWLQRLHRARECLVPWIEETAPLAGRTVLEYGCGQGAIACAVAPRAARHIGVDIAAGEVAMARQHIARRGLANVELSAVPEGEMLDRVAAYRGTIDVFLFYRAPRRPDGLRPLARSADRRGTFFSVRALLSPCSWSGHDIVVLSAPARAFPP